MMKRAFLVLLAALGASTAVTPTLAVEPDSILVSKTFAGLSLRSLGPALTSGRITDVAVHPSAPKTWFVAVACGNLWRTTNAGTTWKPVFDGEGSYSIGCVTIDPSNPLNVWVGTGENNSQRSVAFGDGVYRSVDGGESWKNVGLPESEHIGQIVVDPRNSNVVYVAAQGPLWRSGGDRGLYKTTDFGETWTKILDVNGDTGANELVYDPRNPDILIASTYQRRRHTWTLINGGPGSGLHKSTDAGATWTELKNGLPKSDMGRIGLAVSPVDPDVVYAIVEAADDESGFYRSVDFGANWDKRSDHVSGSPQYYNEIVADPLVRDRVYSLETWLRVTEDGGKSFSRVNPDHRHVDDHAMWINPNDSDHLLVGCDGGLYETHDRAETWDYKANLPITQFYKVAVDSAVPFYNVFGGTQDNFTLAGPSRTRNIHGIQNSDWIVTVGGDGFQTRVDPVDPDIVYSQWQYGGLVRFDRKSGEITDIKPQAEPGEEPLRFNWDSPLIISPHSNSRLYFASNRLFRSDDRGNSWTPVSGDLTRQIDRNELEVMGRVWSVDAVAKNASTSFYGNIVSLTESPFVEGLIYAGTDDGLVQITEDGGKSWRRVGQFAGVPDRSYVAHLAASVHDADVVFAVFNNHKMGDFRPYVMRSNDRGRTWRAITGDLPSRGPAWVIAQDHVDRDLLFAGTEFGVFFSPDAGARWIQLEGGIPTVAVRDLALQRRENDLVVATFGRSFYILDDYSPLRHARVETLAREAKLFDVKPAWIYIPSWPLGLKGKSFQGDNYFLAENPPYGAIFTYHLAEEIQSRRDARREAEKKAAEAGEDVFYPTWADLEAEDREEAPEMILTVTDMKGNVIRRLTGPVEAGFHRIAWDLRYPPVEPTEITPPSFQSPFSFPDMGPLAPPGEYQVTLAKRVDGVVTQLDGPVTFRTVPLGDTKFPARDPQELLAFQRKTGDLQRAVLGAIEATGEAQDRIDHLKQALRDTPEADPDLGRRARQLEARLKDLVESLTGDATIESRNAPAPPSIRDRIGSVVEGHWYTTGDPTGTHRRAYEIAAAEFEGVLKDLRGLMEEDLPKLEEEAEKAGAPWTPGRVPRWSRD